MRSKNEKPNSEAIAFISERMNEIQEKYKGEVSMAAFFIDNHTDDMLSLAHGETAAVAMAMQATAKDHADFELALLTAALMRILTRNGGDVQRSVRQVRDLYEQYIVESRKSAKDLPN